MECTLSKPVPAKWYKNGIIVSASETIKLVADGANHTFTIDRAQLTDTGEYSIKAEGKTSKAEVTVNGKLG